MDNDGHGNPVHLQVKVTITDDEFIADFTGSDPQVVGCVNSGATAAYAGVKGSLYVCSRTRTCSK